jgi:hypothetical protein
VTGSAALAGNLPDGPANGLSAIAADLIDHPHTVRVVVALVDTAKITEKVDDGTKVPTVRVRRIEAITDAEDAALLRRLLLREFERRTGQAVLPLDLETDVRSVFDDPDAEAMP